MKKYLYLASAAALAFASCSDDLGLKNPAAGEVEGGVQATFEFGGSDETRTALQYNGGYKYVWSPNDQIGIFNAKKNAANPEILLPDVTNAVFTYASGTTTAKFNGDSDILLDGEYVAYYPWERDIELTKGTGTGKKESAVLPMTIPTKQNFNYKASQVAWSSKYATGCFGENVAPALASGKATADGEIQLSFYSTASYLVVPIQGYTTANIKAAKLQLFSTDGEGQTTYQTLSGTFNVDVLQFLNNRQAYMLGGPTSTGDSTHPDFPEGTGEDYVYLYFGANGLELDPSKPLNLWFVVPTWTQLANQKLVVSFYNSYDVTDASAMVTYVERTLDGKNFSDTNDGMVGYDSVRWIFAESGTPFSVTNVTDAYVISTPQQFLEYAYLASCSSINSVFQNQYAQLKYKGYSDLMNMVTWSGDASKPIKGLKDALIAGDIKFDYATMQNWIKSSPGFGGAQSLSGLEPYYAGAYGEYAYGVGKIPAGYIKSIGGNDYINLTIKGITDDAGLNGLNVYTVDDGDGFFTDQNAKMSYVSNLTISNAKVNATYAETKPVQHDLAAAAGYGFLANVYGKNITLTNITVGSGCSFVPYQGSNVALFNVIKSTDYMNAVLAGSERAVVADNMSLSTLPMYANELDIYHAQYQANGHKSTSDYAMDFSAQANFAAVNNFRKLYLVPNTGSQGNGYGSLLRIPGVSGDNVPNVVSLMDKITNNIGYPTVATGRLPYSIVDTNLNSYWTGTNSYYTDQSAVVSFNLLAPGTAEQLASVVQINEVTSTFAPQNSLGNQAPYKLNLMGSYKTSNNKDASMTWWNAGKNVTAGSSVGTTLYVSNVYMDGYRTAGTGGGLALVTSESVGEPSTPGSGTADSGNSTPALNNTSIFMTLFGNDVNANKVNVADFTVTPAEKTTRNNIIIATFGFEAVGETNSNLTVGQMTVNNESWNTLYGVDEYNKSGHIGGLFMIQTINNISNCNIKMSANSFNGWVHIGLVAGHLDYQITDINNTLANAVSANTSDIFQAYGDMYFTVTGFLKSSSTLNVNGFGVPFNKDNLFMYFQPGANANATDQYALFLNQGGTNRSQWFYNFDTNSWDYNGTFAD